jgi:hypothetical protein
MLAPILVIDIQKGEDALHGLAEMYAIGVVGAIMVNLGSSAFDLSAGDAGLFYPRGTNNSAVFASGMWLGATVNDTTRVTVAEYSQEFGPGAMVGGTFDDPTKPEYVV